MKSMEKKKIGKSLEDWTSRQKKDKTERVTELGRRMREEIAKWNQMTAHKTFLGSLWGLLCMTLHLNHI